MLIKPISKVQIFINTSQTHVINDSTLSLHTFAYLSSILEDRVHVPTDIPTSARKVTCAGWDRVTQPELAVIAVSVLSEILQTMAQIPGCTPQGWHLPSGLSLQKSQQCALTQQTLSHLSSSLFLVGCLVCFFLVCFFLIIKAVRGRVRISGSPGKAE